MTDPPTTLDEAADELYAVPPEQFTARRDELVREVRDAGERDLAKSVKAFRRPTVAAWVLNRAVRGDVPELSELLDLGTELRQAQEDLNGPLLRELSRRRQELEAGVVRRLQDDPAGDGRDVSPAAWVEVEQTLHAAAADADAAAALRSGRLTHALSYAGFGSVDVSDATATPLRPAVDEQQPAPAPEARSRRTPPSKPREPGGDALRQPEQARRSGDREERERRERDEREQRLRELEAEVDDAHSAATEAQRRRDETAAAEERAEAVVDDLHDRLQDAREALSIASKEAESAERELGRAERSLAATQRRLDREQQRTTGRGS